MTVGSRFVTVCVMMEVETTVVVARCRQLHALVTKEEGIATDFVECEASVGSGSFLAR